ncbi:glycosyltransferase [Pontibacillus salipaludis]|uniref:Glycosyl transferase family 2 n=1 Tax=Pontibacillus salipaludis TaxID=1697394 RepID=A0ABQ1Q244_9BACI|nr:glycosyltransferase family 2 protein [Pontibacillus salipaludis]GGD10909.1 glycosyl transferase family 2 [Pontibacillus salipaludis]
MSESLLSLCMIVKDEESTLNRCLQTVQGIVDEIVIVDTGSSDSTKSIANLYTEKVHNFTWNNNFSQARNYAASKAKGQWILVIDADEYVDSQNLLELKEELYQASADNYIYKVNIVNFAGNNGEELIQHQHGRIYRNIDSIKFDRPIHEQLTLNGEVINGKESSLVIYHSGYISDVVKKKKKGVRNKELIQRELKKQNVNAFDYFNLGNEYNMIGEHEEALACYRKAFIMKKDFSYTWVPFNVVQLIHTLISLKRFSEALDVIIDAEAIWEDAIDFQYLKGLIYFQQNRYEDSKSVLKPLLEKEGKYNKVLVSLNYKNIYPLNILGNIAVIEGEDKKAVKYFSESLQHNKHQKNVLVDLIRILLIYHNEEEVEGYIEKLNINGDKNQLLETIRLLYLIPAPSIAYDFFKRIEFPLEINKGLKIKQNLLSQNIKALKGSLLQLSIEELQLLIKKQVVDIYDISIILYQIPSLYEDITSMLVGEQRFFVDKMLSSYIVKNVYIPNYLELLERCIKYKYFDTFEQLLKKRDDENSALTLHIGHYLYRNDFKQLALDYYLLVRDEDKLDEISIIRICERLIEGDQVDNALRLLFSFLENGRSEFLLYKKSVELLELIGANEDKGKVAREGLKVYPRSNWLLKNS